MITVILLILLGDDVRRMFQEYDDDNSGAIDAVELRRILKSWGMTQSASLPNSDLIFPEYLFSISQELL